MMKKISIVILLFASTLLYGMAHTVNFDEAVHQAIAKYGVKTEPELKRYFRNAQVAYPPREIALLTFKKEKEIQLWAKNEKNYWKYIRTYPLTAFSGQLGPKLKERDRQIPEGIYRLTSFNPFSTYHLSMMINYPNEFDRKQAQKEGRRHLGNNIFLHGKATSVGCLAIGDKAIDQLFLLTHRVGLAHTKLIIAPNDLRRSKPATSYFAQPKWLPELYQTLQKELSSFPLHQIS